MFRSIYLNRREMRCNANVERIRAIVIPKAPSGVQSIPTCCLAFLPVENMPPPIEFVVTTAEPLPDFAIFLLFTIF